MIESQTGRKRSLRSLLGALVAIGWRHRWAALPAMFSTLGLQLATLGAFVFQGLAIDVLRSEVGGGGVGVVEWPLGLEPPGEWSLAARMSVVCGGVLVFSCLLLACRLGVRVSDEHFIQRVVVDLRNRLYGKLQRLPFAYFDGHETGQIINRLTGDVQAMRSFIQGVMVRSVIAVVSLCVFLVYMLSVHVGLTLACLAVLPAQAVLLVVYNRLIKPMFLRQRELEDAVVNELSESIAGVRVVRSFGREGGMLERFLPKVDAACEQRVGIARLQGSYMSAVNAAPFVAMAILLGYGGWLVVGGGDGSGAAGGGIALGTVWVFAGLLERLSSQVSTIAQVVGQAPEALASAERVLGIMDEPTPIEERAGALEPEGFAGRVEFEDVWFGYGGGEPVLRGVSFVAEAGRTIAIVGPTGCGKSTLLSLVARFHDPERGRVLIDGVDARELSPSALRRAVGIVFQEAFLFSTSIRSNVALADPGMDRGLLDRAIDDASARDVVEEAPRGLETIIGERGVSLSGGQRQRLTIARALAVDPAILILDDATGAVDAITEASIQGALDRQARRRTVFVVAHRLSTLRKADRIIVLDGGRVVDSGTHEELMGRDGYYRSSALIQLARGEGGDGGGDRDAGAGAGAGAEGGG